MTQNASAVREFYQCGQALRELRDELVGIRSLAGRGDHLVRRLRQACSHDDCWHSWENATQMPAMIAHLTVCAHPVAYILADRRGEEDVFLGNDAGVGAEVVQVVASQRVPVQRDAARDDVVESLHEGDRGRFPATGLADERNPEMVMLFGLETDSTANRESITILLLARLDTEGKPAQHLLLLFRGVCNSDTFRVSETDSTTNPESITILPLLKVIRLPLIDWQRVCAASSG